MTVEQLLSPGDRRHNNFLWFGVISKTFQGVFFFFFLEWIYEDMKRGRSQTRNSPPLRSNASFSKLSSRRAGGTFILILVAPFQCHDTAINFVKGEKISEYCCLDWISASICQNTLKYYTQCPMKRRLILIDFSIKISEKSWKKKHQKIFLILHFIFLLY